jgi:hypothetical protein
MLPHRITDYLVDCGCTVLLCSAKYFVAWSSLSGKALCGANMGHKKRLKFALGKVDTLRECGILSVVDCV